MFTNKARILVIGLFVILLAVILKLRIYELAAVAVLFILFTDMGIL
jgi:hypothetical protein